MPGFDIGLYCRRGRGRRRFNGFVATLVTATVCLVLAAYGGHRLLPGLFRAEYAGTSALLAFGTLLGWSARGQACRFVAGRRWSNHLDYVVGWPARRLLAAKAGRRPHPAVVPAEARPGVSRDTPVVVPAPALPAVTATSEPVPAAGEPPAGPPFPGYKEPNESGISNKERRRRIRANGELTKEARRPGNNGHGVTVPADDGWDETDRS